MEDYLDDYEFVSVYVDLLEDYPGAVNLASEAEARGHRPLMKDAEPDQEGTRPQTQADEHGLPVPTPYEGEHFTVLDYQSEEYAGAANIDEAIAIRGRKAFFDQVEPEDFESLPDGVSRIGIASLWSQSTWDTFDAQSRNVSEEQSAGLKPGDILVLGRIPVDLPEGQNWGEIQDLGFGFYRGGEFLPFTPYHDYDQQLFIETIKFLDAGEWIECVVRSAACNGEDGVEDDISFCWRVYSLEVTVFKVRETA